MREVDYTASVAFLRKFFAHTQGNVELRAIGSESGNEKPDFTRDTDRVEEFCQRNDEPGTAIYFGCATRIVGHSRGKRENLAEIICALIDIDADKLGLPADEVVAALKGCPCPPSIIVHSGHGIHAYWLWREAIDVTDWDEDQDEAYTAFLKRLAACFAGDDKCTDLPRVMRLPGTHNSKKTEAEPEGGWHQCRVLDENDRRYELGDLVEMLDLLQGRRLIVAPEVEWGGASSVPFNQPNIGDQFLDYGLTGARFDMSRLTLMSHQDAENPIHATRIAAAASLVQKGEMDDGEIFDLLLAATVRAAGLAGQRWNWRQEEKTIQEEIASAHRKWPKEPDPKVVQLRPGQSERPEPDVEPAPEFMGYPLNDLGNALRLLAQHAAAMRYVLNIGWHIWDKRRFAYDPESVTARHMAHQTVKDILTQAFEARGVSLKAKAAIMKFAVSCGNSGRVANMLHEAEPHIAHKAEALDADPWLLNCRNGTVDLRTGELRGHAQSDLITKLAGTRYEPLAACPRWERFLLEIFGGDPAKGAEDNAAALEMVGFLQRALGYSLTGLTTEQVLFIMYGTGANGKSVLTETITAVIGEYVRHSPAETWVSKPTGSSTNDIAALVGARFVSVIETEQDRHLAEALVKQATGGDMITARFHYKEFFSYVPQFKLWFATNHRPKIRGSDYAIWRRIYLLPFTVKFVEAGNVGAGEKARDPDLKKNLKSEHPGILAWMVRGCLEWQHGGLQPPATVREATQAYQDREDNVSGFLRDCCGFSRGVSCSPGLLYAAYQVWCEEEEEEALVKRLFLRNLDDRGFPAGARTMQERLRKGLDLNTEYREKARNRQAEPPLPMGGA